MKNFNLKNKISIIVILLLVVFSFSNKAQAAYSISVVSKDDRSVSLKAGGLTPGAINLFSLQVINDQSSGNTTEFHDVSSITNAPDASGNLIGTISGLTPESKYIAKLNKKIVGTDQNITVIELKNVKFTTDKTLDPHICNLYSVNKNNGTPLPIPQYWFLPLEGTYSNIWKGPYDTLDKCTADLDAYKPTTIPGSGNVGVGDTSVNSDNIYTPLAPLPDTTGTSLTSFDASQPNAFGNYFNMLIRLFIGICAVLAMIMIVMGGIEYMTSELSHHKEEGKERITNAIFGLLIALGAFALLNTINPQLLDISLISLQNAGVELETPSTAVEPSSYAPPSGAYNKCTEGFEKITTSGGDFWVCKKLSASAKTMIDLAWSQGIKLTGGSFRTRQQQEYLRAQNCGGSQNIYNKNVVCHPPTAYPGTSNHESGLAFDLKCEGILIQTHDNKCFIWLKANASNYQLFNLSSEPWHWSINGN